MQSILPYKQKIIDARHLITSGNLYETINFQLESFAKIVLANKQEETKSQYSNFYVENHEKFEDGMKIINDYRTKMIVDHQPIVQISDEELSILISMLSSTNRDQRDTGAYFFLSELIENGILNENQRIELLNTLMSDEYLFTEIDIPNGNFVFRRSFSILLLAVIAGYQNPETLEKFLPDEMMNLDYLVLQTATYSMLEMNTEGFRNEYGWVHAIFHVGNLVSALVNNQNINDLDKLFLIAAMLNGYAKNKTPYTMGEPDRITETLIETLNNLDNHFLVDYIKTTFNQWEEKIKKRFVLINEADWNQIYNLIHFQQNVLLKIDAFPYDFKEFDEGDSDYE